MKTSNFKRNSKIVIGLIFIIYLLNCLQTVSLGETGKVTYGGPVTWSGSTVGKFSVNGQIAFCIDHKKSTPPGGTGLTGQTSTNSNIIKCLYYGWGGNEQWGGFGSEAQGIVQTTLALDYYTNGNPHNAANSFINYLESVSTPHHWLDFSNKNLTATKQGNKQVTNSTTIQGNSGIIMTLKLQNNVTIVCENRGWSQTGGSVNVSAGDVLHFEAPLTVTGTWVSDSITNSNYKWQAIIYSTSSSSYQRLGGSLNIQPDPTTTTNLTLNWLTMASFKIIKKDVAGDVIPGNTFHIWNNDGYDTSMTTNSNGEIILEDVDPGTYYIKETAAPSGYTLNPNTYNITVNSGDTADTKNITITNEKPTGTIILSKIIAIRENTDTLLVDISDLSGIEFKLIAKEDIIDKTNDSKIYSKGQEINIYKLSKDGKLTIKDLPMGVYEIVEIKTLDGLILNTMKYEVKFEQKDLTTKVYTENLDILNDTTLVEFSKTDITGDKELEGATLQVIDENGNIVDEWISTNKSHKIEGLTVGKTYILHEEIAPKDYKKASDIKFKVENTKEIQKVTMVDEIDEIPVTITKIAKQTSPSGKFLKGQHLAGCEFTIYDEDGNILKVVTTDETGSITFNLLRNYKYLIKETKAPEEYLNDSEPQEIYLNDKVTTLSLEFYNNPIVLELDISKIGIRQAQPNDIIRYDFQNLINKSNVYLNDFTWLDTLPYEYVKITKLYTGTYNEDLDYKVFYKINTEEEYKQYGNTYNTKQNNCINFENLGLDNINTYITDFKIVFGTVKPGFSAIDTPFIFTKVDDNVTKEDEWFNNTKLTGNYTDQFGNKTELSDEDNWKTISYGAKLNTITIKKLPRTGNELSPIYRIFKLLIILLTTILLNIKKK